MSRIVANRDRNGDGALSRDDRPQDGKHRWRHDGKDQDRDQGDGNQDDGETTPQ